ncbi:hypothetical protein CMUS01_12417 [Colletotrichum musicola]|uniref:Uncharacterized protein n=1 Tax=Colletotrichum musicola TaxID=2175873 RepID=A0A8H6N158_9PEZI|nr:hypothetical protein CMUS01_12417 [Colletotrichum musicola]
MLVMFSCNMLSWKLLCPTWVTTVTRRSDGKFEAIVASSDIGLTMLQWDAARSMLVRWNVSIWEGIRLARMVPSEILRCLKRSNSTNDTASGTSDGWITWYAKILSLSVSKVPRWD